jgi:hypothetical protein
VSLEPGAYTGAQRLAVTGAGDPVTYSLDGAAPRTYTGVAIDLGVGTHTVVLRSQDAAGNVTERSLAYEIRPVPAPAPPAQSAGAPSTGAGAGAQQSGLTSLAGPLATAPPPRVTAGSPAEPPLLAVRRGARRLTLAAARRDGFVVRFTAPAGARSAVVRILRRRGGRLTLLGSRTAVVRAGRVGMRLRSRALRRRLRAGELLVEVTLRGAGGRAETATWVVRLAR